MYIKKEILNRCIYLIVILCLGCIPPGEKSQYSFLFLNNSTESPISSLDVKIIWKNKENIIKTTSEDGRIIIPDFNIKSFPVEIFVVTEVSKYENTYFKLTPRENSDGQVNDENISVINLKPSGIAISGTVFNNLDNEVSGCKIIPLNNRNDFTVADPTDIAGTFIFFLKNEDLLEYNHEITFEADCGNTYKRGNTIISTNNIDPEEGYEITIVVKEKKNGLLDGGNSIKAISVEDEEPPPEFEN
ncbi:MAG: hypothetical protein H8E55_26625 [Pelagibacterales bacterium]|nr:hypothetical protein [Pelagibacterales bacterium]